MITGSAIAQTISFPDLFNSSYKNYRICLEPTTQVNFQAFPSYSLQAFTGTSVPTMASLYGYDITSSAITPVYTASATIATNPLLLAASCATNNQIIIEVLNVGFVSTTTQSQIIQFNCKSLHSSIVTTGVSDKTITAELTTIGASITGLTLRQSSIGFGNNFTLKVTVYGYVLNRLT